MPTQLMEYNMDFSFVVTVYNMEKYVADCLNSLVSQQNTSYKYEIIVVNDGSKDSSIGIINEFAKKYANIRVLNQPNGGLSIARNNGLAMSSGRWIWFIDSDDMVSLNSLSDIEKLESSHDLEAMVFSIENFSVNEHYTYADRSSNKGEIITGRDYMRSGFPCQVPFTIYKRDYLIINDLKMKPGIFHEDMEFSPRAYYGLKKIGFITDVLYLRRITPNSITHSINWKKNFDCLIVAESLYSFSETVEDKDKVVYYNLISRVLDNSLHNNQLMDDEIKKKFSSSLAAQRKLFYKMVKSSYLKYRIQGILYSILPHNVLTIYNILYKISGKRKKSVVFQ